MVTDETADLEALRDKIRALSIEDKLLLAAELVAAGTLTTARKVVQLVEGELHVAELRAALRERIGTPS